MIFWLLYFLGQAAHVFSKAFFVIRSKNSGVTGYRQYVMVNLAPMIVRFLFATAFFIWWFDDPMLVNNLFSKIGWQFSPGIIHDIVMGVQFPLNAGTAMIYGLCCDSVLDKFLSLIPWMRKDVPPLGVVENG